MVNENANVTRARGYAWKQPHHVHTPTSAWLLRHCGHSGRPRPTAAGPLPPSGNQCAPGLSARCPCCREASQRPRPAFPSRGGSAGPAESSETAVTWRPREPHCRPATRPRARRRRSLSGPTRSSVNGGDDWACRPKGSAVGSAHLNHQKTFLQTRSRSCALSSTRSHTFFLWTPSPCGTLRKGHWRKGGAGQPCPGS